MLWRRERSDDGQGEFSRWRLLMLSLPVDFFSLTTGWKLTVIHSLRHLDRFAPRSAPEVTSLAFTARTLYSGDSDGKLWLWSPPGTELFLSDAQAPQCMGCSSKFGLMESESAPCHG